MKITFIVPSLKSGGLERVATVIANYGAKCYSITLISLDSKPSFYQICNKVSLVLTPNKIANQNKLYRFFLTGFWLRNVVKNQQPNIICSFGEKYNPFVLLFLLGLKIPVFVANRTSPLSSIKGLYGRINPTAYKFAAGVILQTKQSINILEGKYDLKRVAVIGNPVEINFAQDKRENIILNVGSIGGNKNQNLLIHYFSELNTQNWKLIFAGDGPLMKKCLAMSEELGCQEKIDFLGIVKDVKRLYSKSAIFAFTSTLEGFPNALAEAMAAGCACISFDCVAGPSDIIDDGINGILIPVGNDTLYKEKLQLLMEDQGLRERFSIAAKEKMNQFEASYISNKFYNFITEEVENSN
jgi:glycosyltransferase involved in cell wall biosynthesis